MLAMKAVATIEELSPVVSFETRWAFSLLAMKAVAMLEELSSAVPFGA